MTFNPVNPFIRKILYLTLPQNERLSFPRKWDERLSFPIPTKVGISIFKHWIPAGAGMTLS